MEGGRDGRRKEGREGGRDGRDRGMEGGREGWKEEGREGGRGEGWRREACHVYSPYLRQTTNEHVTNTMHAAWLHLVH